MKLVVFLTVLVVAVTQANARAVFTLARTGTFGPASSSGEKVKWNEVLLDEGNDINPGLDTFVAPRDSAYRISWTVKGILAQATLRVKSGDAEDIKEDVETAGGSLGSDVSNTVILELKAGDEVSIYLQGSNNGFMGCGFRNACIFSGNEM